MGAEPFVCLLFKIARSGQVVFITDEAEGLVWDTGFMKNFITLL
jgi:hypothetical protein